MNVKVEFNWRAAVRRWCLAAAVVFTVAAGFAGDIDWWVEARFGMFIHFGLYALPARHEWVKTYEQIPDAEYQKYFERFDPDLFDAREWVRAAKAAGMKYIVLTTKHHEGFCLWDSAVTDYKITNTPFGRDLLKEFTDACHEEGMRVGFYYSLLDWHHPDFTVDGYHPLRPVEMMADGDYDSLNVGKDMARYRQYMKDQVTELLTRYGKVDILWFDFSYPKFKGRADWDSEGLLALARRLQPGIIVDNRMDLNDVPGGFDFVTPEQVSEAKWPEVDGRRVPWERCQTFSGSWGYFRDQHTWKSRREVIEMLVDSVAKGGNLILNVGPTGRGNFDARANDRLAALADWMRLHERAIRGCTQADGFTAPAGTLLTFNPKTNRLYIFVREWTASLELAFADRVAYAQLLNDASETPLKNGALALPENPPPVELPVIEIFLK